MKRQEIPFVVLKRFVYLLVNCDYHLIKLGNALFLLPCGLVLFFQPGYLNSSPVLAQLLDWLPQSVWAAIWCTVGLLELILYVITANPPLFARGEYDVRIWYWLSAAGFWACIALYGLLTFLLSPAPTGYKIGLGNVLYGWFTLGSFLGGARAGAAIEARKRQEKTMDSPMEQAEIIIAAL